jgi:hypothetical protein
MPALIPAAETDIESVDGAVPEAGDRLIHVALVVAVHASVPLPLFVI